VTFHPTALALALTALISTVLLAGTLPFAFDVLQRWDLSRSDAAQLSRERRVELVSTIVALVLFANLGSLLAFVMTTDRIASQLVGAMCAAGALNANPWGYPTLGLGLAVFFVASAWLVTHAVNRRGFDYPLVRAQHALLFVLAPLVAAYGATMLVYFGAIDPAVITSCCSTLFDDARADAPAHDLAALPPAVAIAVFAALFAALVGLGARVVRSARGALPYTLVALATFAAAIALVVSVLAPYTYELPHHHCPFCVLKREYGFVGYGLYGGAFTGAALAIGVTVAGVGARLPSLSVAGPKLARRFAAGSLAGFTLFTGLAIAIVARSQLVLFEAPFVDVLLGSFGGP
jgi:hypothetical protein